MPNREVKHLFRLKRFPENEFKILCLLLYLPIGLVLLVLRAVLALSLVLIGCVVADSGAVHKIINKIACITLGISVSVENAQKKENVEVFVSNKLSIFDNLAVHAATGAVHPGDNKNMHPAFARGLGLQYFGSQSNLESFKKNIAQAISDKKFPIYFTPEDKITNGKALLKFKSYPFSLTNKVQPICITIERPFLDISVTTVGASYWTDVLFYMFSPLTNYKLTFLPPLEKKSLNDSDFCEAVRHSIATALKIETSSFQASDLLEWEKRFLIEQQRPQPTPRPVAIRVDGETKRMALQVKEVLPHVPLVTIYKDLSKTRSVDATITNILEGRVSFTPEAPPNTPLSQPSSSSSSSSSSSASLHASPSHSKDLFNTAATTFAKSANERTKSFQERKEQLIANARRRYIEKHNLDIPL